MCTLTFTGPGLVLAANAEAEERTMSPGDPAGGYRIWFNRDELRSRGPEIPPSEARTPTGVRYIAPTDSDAGGTWIAANEFGVTVALLNGFIESKGPPRALYTSRGALVRSLADLAGISQVWSRLTPARLADFRPSVLCVLAPGERPAVIRWDGRDVEIDVLGDRQLPLTSSSYEQDEVQRFRRDLYREQVTARAAGGPPRPSDLAAFHAFIGGDGPSAMTPSMAREDAATRSHCVIHVLPGETRFGYIPGPPHGAPELTTVTLRSPHAPGLKAIPRPLAPVPPGGSR